MTTFQLPRLYPILDTAVLAVRGMPLETAAQAVIEAGVRILQIRHKSAWTREDFAAAERIAGICKTAGVTLIVNDRADIAALLDAGLHVGQEDLEPSAARRVIGANAVLGYSTHNASQLAAGDAEPVSYLAIGPIFATVSKENPDPIVGVTALTGLRGLTRRPLVAIGGITQENARVVLEAGADSVAVIGGLLPEEPTAASLRRRVEEWLKLTQ